MSVKTDSELVREYVRQNREGAFTELVERYLNLVFSAALRTTADRHLAQDAAQETFVALAQRAPFLMDRSSVAGWLHRTACNLAAKKVRGEVRRRSREAEVSRMQIENGADDDAVWEQVSSQLDAALNDLGGRDRDILLLRYLQQRTIPDIALELGLKTEAAQKRVSRALDKLRGCLSIRGVVLTSASLATLLPVKAVLAAPTNSAAPIAATALAQACNAGWFAGLLKPLVAVEVKATLTAAACFLAVGIALGVERSTAAALPGQVVAQAVTVASSPPPGAKRVANAPTTAFGQVYSPDLRTFAANLRRIRCPELTVKDIIVAQINKQFQEREYQLRATPADHVPFGWNANTPEMTLQRHRNQARQLAVEKAAMIRAALGYDVPVELPSFVVNSSDLRFEAGMLTLPPDQRLAVRQAQESYWSAAADLMERTKGFWLPEDVDALNQLKATRRQNLTAILGEQTSNGAKINQFCYRQSHIGGGLPFH
jgi:RNA polymerase sigma factor (sigma-70 family)